MSLLTGRQAQGVGLALGGGGALNQAAQAMNVRVVALHQGWLLKRVRAAHHHGHLT